MAGPLRSAVILAAGMGTRLREVVSDRPKGFVEFGEESLVERSLRLLRERGIERTVIVAGHMAHAYHDLAKRCSDVEVVENEAFAETGSMASLARALEVVHEDFVLLESDLFFEARALDEVMGVSAPDVLLASGPTGATDEVWVEVGRESGGEGEGEGQGGRLHGLSKERRARARAGEGRGPAMELVGILRVSAALGVMLKRAYDEFVDQHSHGRMSYETDALVIAARERPVRVHLIPDLLWGEVDYESHYRRVRDEVWPACNEKEAHVESEPA